MGKQRKGELPMEFFRKELDIDVMAVYERLKDVATLPPEAMRDRYKLSAAINTAARNSVLVRKLHLKARKEREIFRIEFSRSTRRLTREAIERIEAWMRDNEIKKKVVTKEMVKEEIAATDHLREEYHLLVLKQQELRDIRDLMETLANEWSQRKSTLQTQASLNKAQKEVVFGDTQ